MLKIKEPTLDRLVTLGKSYDTSAHIQKATFGKEANANKVQSGYKQEKFNANRNKAKENTPQRNNPPSSSERCKSCGGTPCVFIHPRNPPEDQIISEAETFRRFTEAVAIKALNLV